MPKNTLRLKVYYDITPAFKITLSSIYSSKYYIRFANINPSYEYQNQRFDPLFGEGGNQNLVGGKIDNRYILNFRIDKYFIDNKLDIFVYGYDITGGYFVEGINQLETIYPRQIGTMFGGGVNYKF